MLKNMQDLKNIETKLLESKMKNFLFSINLNEKYVAFDYLTYVLVHLIKNENTNFRTYKQAIGLLVDKYGITYRTIVQGLHKIISMCTSSQILSIPEFQSGKSKTIHRIRIIKTISEDFLLKEFN